MKERIALTLAVIVPAAITLLVLIVLSVLGASSRLLAFVYVLLLCISADTAARVALRYRR